MKKPLPKKFMFSAENQDFFMLRNDIYLKLFRQLQCFFCSFQILHCIIDNFIVDYVIVYGLRALRYAGHSLCTIFFGGGGCGFCFSDTVMATKFITLITYTVVAA